jgi:hypothetical protein
VWSQHVDELFHLPSTTIAMPRAYWHTGPTTLLSSAVLVIEPSSRQFERIKTYIATTSNPGFDMEILNALYNSTAMILPHRPYLLLSLEFRATQHTAYLGEGETWDAKGVLEEAKYVHFSDWPVEKPWVETLPMVLEANSPACAGDGVACVERDIWVGLRREFAERRKVWSWCWGGVGDSGDGANVGLAHMRCGVW